ncbi:MAG: helicase HerA-like domain-containing protein, partial [Arenimonas sp.]
QHALRAYTPRDQKAVRAAAETFVQNPKIDVAKVISELAVGEALVSTLQEKGIPSPVERAYICPPRCRMGAITDEERAIVRSRSPVGVKYDTAIDRESAYEMLNKVVQDEPVANEKISSKAKVPAAEPAPKEEPPSRLNEFLWGTKRRQGAVETAAKSATRTVASGLGRQLLRGLLGGLLGGKRR